MDSYLSQLKSLEFFFRKKPIDETRELGLPEIGTSQIGLAGSAIFFNVAGVHRRGEFDRAIDRKRLVLLIDFRQNDSFIIPKKFRI